MFGIFNDNFPPVLDGVALTAKNYADWLHRKQQDVCVVTPYAPGMVKNTPYPIYDYASVPIPMRPPYRYGLPQIDLSFRRRYSNLHFDLIHAHCPFTTGMLALKTGREQGIPVVATFHSKYRQDFERAVSSKTLVDYAVKRIIEFYNQAFEVWIPQAAVEPTLREYGYKGHVEVVENGNDFVTPDTLIEKIRYSMRGELGIHADQTMMLFVGQHIWEKNIGFILDALKLIHHLPFRLYMIGTGYAEGQIRQIISKNKMEQKVIMLGMINDRETLRRYYAAADLFLFPSLYDNAPLVVREAAALQTPSVMIQGSTASEIIHDNYNGFLTPNDVQLYANAIRSLMENPHLRREVGVNASKTIARSWENVVEEVIARYQDIQKRYKQTHKKA